MSDRPSSIDLPDEKGYADERIEGAYVSHGDWTDEQRNKLSRKIVFKQDLRILPMLALLFLFSFLDRVSVGNAKVFGLQKDLHLTTAKYQHCLAIFYAFYIASEVPSNLAIKKVSPRIWLGTLTFLWGAISMCMGFVKSYTGLMIVRAFLGAAEGGLLPGIVLFLSMNYKRSEMGIRLGLIYSSASLSGAFGGLLALGLNGIGGKGLGSFGHESWRWIFIAEGLMTMVVGLLAGFLLPSSIETASFLTPEERLFAAQRLKDDRPSGNAASEEFSWAAVCRAILSVQTWLSALAYFAILCALYSFGLFVPSIIVGLGYTASRAQLFSVPPYAAAALLTVVAAYLSDRVRLRGPIILAFLPLSIIGYSVIRAVDVPNVKYGALFLMACGLYPSVPPILVWLSNNSAGHYKRATAVGLQLAIANCSGFVATFLYPAHQAPNYVQSHTVILSVLCAAWLLVLANVLYCRWQNSQKRAGKMDRYIGCGDDRDPTFIYIT